MHAVFFGFGWVFWVWRPEYPRKGPRALTLVLGFFLIMGIWKALTQDNDGETQVQMFLDRFSFLFGTALLYLVGALVGAAGYREPEKQKEEPIE